MLTYCLAFWKIRYLHETGKKSDIALVPLLRQIPCTKYAESCFLERTCTIVIRDFVCTYEPIINSI